MPPLNGPIDELFYLFEVVFVPVHLVGKKPLVRDGLFSSQQHSVFLGLMFSESTALPCKP